jgi:hypothetical protein
MNACSNATHGCEIRTLDGFATSLTTSRATRRWKWCPETLSERMVAAFAHGAAVREGGASNRHDAEPDLSLGRTGD